MIKPIIDFSAKLGPARDQHHRGMCLAFASSDFNQYHNTLADPLSVEYLAHHAATMSPGWAPTHGLTVQAVVASLNAPGQPFESDYPYVPTVHTQPLVSPPAGINLLHTAQVTQVDLLPAGILTSLQNGKAICLGFELNDNWYNAQSGVIPYSAQRCPERRHAVLGVGLGINEAENQHYILVRNSWGDAWGNAGHAWLATQYLVSHLLTSFAI